METYRHTPAFSMPGCSLCPSFGDHLRIMPDRLSQAYNPYLFCDLGMHRPFGIRAVWNQKFGGDKGIQNAVITPCYGRDTSTSGSGCMIPADKRPSGVLASGEGIMQVYAGISSTRMRMTMRNLYATIMKIHLTGI